MTLLDFFTSTALSQPHDKLAVEYYCVDEQTNNVIRKRSLTYGELDKVSTQFSLSISNFCGNERAVVGLMLPPSIDLLVGIIGILKAECIFVPLELNLSEELFAKVLEITGTSIIVAQLQHSSKFKNFLQSAKNGCWSLEEREMQGFQIYKWRNSNSGSIFEAFNKDEKIAYMMHTSGTTGEPKWIAVPHRCIEPNITNLSQLFQVRDTSKVAMMSPPTFDPSIVEMFLAFANGAALVIPSIEIKMRPFLLLNVLFQEANVTILQATPALIKRFTLDQLRNETFNDKSSLKTIAFGGESCPNCATIKNWIKPCMLGTNLPWRFFNIYGITEVSSWAMCYEIPINKIKNGDADPIPLGSLLLKTELQIRNEVDDDVLCTLFCRDLKRHDTSGCTLDLSENSTETKGDWTFKTLEGRLYIGGRERICHILGESDEAFRDSGDIVRATVKDGEILSIVYIGRIDSIIKRNGKKFSLSFLTNKLCDIPDVETCHVMKVQDNYGIDKIVAFIVRQHCISKRINSNETVVIRDQESACWSFQCFRKLTEHLEPFYMPDGLKEINLLPITSHGKVNESYLKALFLRETAVKNSDMCEEKLKEALVLILPCCVSQSKKNLDLDFTFSRLGGDSLGATMLINWLEVLLGVSVAPTLPDATDILFSHSLNDFVKIFLKKYRKVEKFNGNDEPCCKKEKINEHEKGLKKSTVHSFHRCSEILCISRGGRICHGLISNHSVDTTRAPVLSSNVILEEIWKYNTGKCVDASPFIAFLNSGGTCFIGSHSHLFSALCLDTGKKIWNYELPDRIESSACLLSIGDTNIVAVGCYDGAVYCFLANSGKFWWKYETGSQVKSSPCWVVGTSLLFVGSHDGFMNALDIQKRKCVWKVNCGGGAVFSSPASYHAKENLMVFIATLGGNLLSLCGYSGDLLWKQNVGKPVFSSPCVNESGVCIGCVDSNVYFYTIYGEKLWTFKTGKPIFSSPVFTLDHTCILIGSHDGYFYNIGCVDGSLVWRICTNDKSPIYSTPFVLRMSGSANLVVFASTTGVIYVADLQSRNILITKTLPGEVFSSPIAVDRGDLCEIVVGCRDDNVYCLRLKYAVVKI